MTAQPIKLRTEKPRMHALPRRREALSLSLHRLSFWRVFLCILVAASGSNAAAHCALTVGPYAHTTWIYVDDLIALLARNAFVEQLALLVCFLTAVHATRNREKAQLGHEVTWRGWTFNVDFETVQLAAGKLEKLQLQLQELARNGKIPRKLLEKTLGLLT